MTDSNINPGKPYPERAIEDNGIPQSADRVNISESMMMVYAGPRPAAPINPQVSPIMCVYAGPDMFTACKPLSVPGPGVPESVKQPQTPPLTSYEQVPAIGEDDPDYAKPVLYVDMFGNRFCAVCSYRVGEAGKFCPNCGSTLKRRITT